MELVEGPTLAGRIANGRLAVDEALTIARQIAGYVARRRAGAGHTHDPLRRKIRDGHESVGRRLVRRRPRWTTIPDAQGR